MLPVFLLSTAFGAGITWWNRRSLKRVRACSSGPLKDQRGYVQTSCGCGVPSTYEVPRVDSRGEEPPATLYPVVSSIEPFHEIPVDDLPGEPSEPETCGLCCGDYHPLKFCRNFQQLKANCTTVNYKVTTQDSALSADLRGFCAAGIALKLRDGSILLVREKNGSWNLPGGKREWNSSENRLESPWETALREFKEEVHRSEDDVIRYFYPHIDDTRTVIWIAKAKYFLFVVDLQWSEEIVMRYPHLGSTTLLKNSNISIHPFLIEALVVLNTTLRGGSS